VAAAIATSQFEDPIWVEQWDVVFAQLYLDALDAELGSRQPVPRPWRLAFAAPPGLPPLRHLLLGINAHVNYDLPRALVAVISQDDFADPQVLGRRQRDHARIDRVLSSRVAAEGDELVTPGGRTLLDRALLPLSRTGSRRFLRESRQKVWANSIELNDARASGDYPARLAELELLSAAKIADLLQPGQVLLRLALGGFGVSLPPPLQPDAEQLSDPKARQRHDSLE
jgi:hypothetical protein